MNARILNLVGLAGAVLLWVGCQTQTQTEFPQVIIKEAAGAPSPAPAGSGQQSALPLAEASAPSNSNWQLVWQGQWPAYNVYASADLVTWILAAAAVTGNDYPIPAPLAGQEFFTVSGINTNLGLEWFAGAPAPVSIR